MLPSLRYVPGKQNKVKRKQSELKSLFMKLFKDFECFPLSERGGTAGFAFYSVARVHVNHFFPDIFEIRWAGI